MAQMTAAQARVIDPIMTLVAQGYTNNEAIGMALFPQVPVGQRGGRIITFGKEDFALYNTIRAPGSGTKRVQFGYAGAPYALEDHSLEALVPVELMQEAQAVPGIDIASHKISGVQDIMALRLEYVQATLATTAANYAGTNKVTLAGTSQWSDLTSGVSDPIKDIETAKEAVRKQIGKRPNVVILGAQVMASVKLHPKVVDRVKFTGRDIPTADLLASLFGVQQVLVGDMIYTDAAGVVQDVWGKFAVVAYTQTATLAMGGAPTFGYTYRLSRYPVVEPAYEDRNAKSWIYPTTDCVMPVLAGASAGYLISGAVA